MVATGPRLAPFRTDRRGRRETFNRGTEKWKNTCAPWKSSSATSSTSPAGCSQGRARSSRSSASAAPAAPTSGTWTATASSTTTPPSHPTSSATTTPTRQPGRGQGPRGRGQPLRLRPPRCWRAAWPNSSAHTPPAAERIEFLNTGSEAMLAAHAPRPHCHRTRPRHRHAGRLQRFPQRARLQRPHPPLERVGPRVSPGRVPLRAPGAGACRRPRRRLAHVVNFNDLDSVRHVCERLPRRRPRHRAPSSRTWASSSPLPRLSAGPAPAGRPSWLPPRIRRM